MKIEMFNFKKKKRAKLKADLGKIKTANFVFHRIERYFHLSVQDDAYQTVSERTWQDLDMDELFMFCDRTSSKVGQQWLYKALRTIPNGVGRLHELDALANTFEQNRLLAEATLFELDRLNRPATFFIPSLFLSKHLTKPEWFWVLPVLLTANIACGVLLLFNPTFIVPLIFLLALSLGIHYWNKNNVEEYSASIPQLMILNLVARNLQSSDGLGEKNDKLNSAIEALQKLGPNAIIFNQESGLQSEIGQLADAILEILKAFFLIEPIILFKVLKKLDGLRTEMQEVFDYVGKVDAALSLSALRASVPYWCRPNVSTEPNQLSGEDIFHPLVHDFVANSLRTDQKSILLTGSNMSGKTTFIRTLGINVVLSQTMGIAFARFFTLSRYCVHSAIGMADDLFNNTSYYFAEVLTIKAMLEASQTEVGNLFLLDELFRGTNTVERIAAGKGVLDYLARDNNLVVVSTHDLELAEYLSSNYNLFHFAEAIENDEIIFDYKLKSGNLDTTNAIRILALNNYPTEIIDEASRISKRSRKAERDYLKKPTISTFAFNILLEIIQNRLPARFLGRFVVFGLGLEGLGDRGLPVLFGEGYRGLAVVGQDILQ